MMLALVCLLSIVCLAISDRDGVTSKKLVALLHAGPGKTGTSHLQAFLVKTENTLLQNKFAVWPNLYPAFLECTKDGRLSPSDAMMDNRVKTLAFYNKYFERCLPIQNSIRDFIRQSAKQNLNVIFSSETFLSYSPGVENIKNMLSAENYQVHAVVAYRFPLSWFISRYKEEIKTSSITSKESNPHEQLTDLLFSEYLIKCWRKYFQPHSFTGFYQRLTSYPDYRLSIVDVYGTAAAQKTLGFVLLCEIAGIMCDSPIFEIEELKSIYTHASESEAVIMERQMGFVFAKFASQHNCTLNFSKKKSKARKFLNENLEWKDIKIPQRPVDISDYARRSLEMDSIFRRRYGKYIVNGNATANALKVTPLPLVMEVDKAAVLSSVKGNYLKEMRSRLKLARKNGLCNV